MKGTIVAAVALLLAVGASTNAQIASAPKPSPRNVEFETGVREANALLSRKQFDAAMRKFDQLRSADAAEYGRTGLAARRDEAVKGLTGQLTDVARELIRNGRLKEATAKLGQTDRLVPGQKSVADLLAEIKQHEDDYQRLKMEGRDAFSAANYSAARDKFDQARSANTDQFDSDGLAVRRADAATRANDAPDDRGSGLTLRSATTLDANALEARRVADMAKQLAAQGKYAEAEAVYVAALRFDARNPEAFEAVEKIRQFKALRDQGLAAAENERPGGGQEGAGRCAQCRPDAVRPRRSRRDARAAPAPTAAKVALQDALLALLKGEAETSIALLEPALAAGGDRNASLHAYLGVAYATRALSAPKPDDRTRLQNQAVEQFKLAASLQPGYRLSDRVVSPAIIRIYEQSR